MLGVLVGGGALFALFFVAGRASAVAPKSSALTNLTKPGNTSRLVRQCATRDGAPVRGDVTLIFHNAFTVQRAKGTRFNFSPSWRSDAQAVGIEVEQYMDGHIDDASDPARARCTRSYYCYYDVSPSGNVALYDTGIRDLFRSGVDEVPGDHGNNIGNFAFSMDVHKMPALLALVQSRVQLGDPRTCGQGLDAIDQAVDHGYIGGAVHVTVPPGEEDLDASRRVTT